VKELIRGGSPVKGAKAIVLGLTFKEDVPDLRNSRVIDVINELKAYGMEVFVHDPVSDPAEARHEYAIDLTSWDQLPRADAMIAAVAHNDYLQMPVDELAGKLSKNGCFVDVKSKFNSAALRAAGICVWRL